MFELSLPKYPYLVRNGIEFPAVLVQHALECGMIHPPAPQTTISRCPVGKKAAALEAKSHKAETKATRCYNKAIADLLNEEA